MVLRLIPVQAPIRIYGASLTLNAFYLAYASLLAGVFEEGLRYALMRSIARVRADLRRVLCFGLGWGFLEAVLIYAVSVLITTLLLGRRVTFLELLPGAVERNVAVMLHVALTLVVFRALTVKALLWVAIAIHALVDLTATLTFQVLNLPVWHVEGMVFAITLATLAYAYRTLKASQPPSPPTRATV